MSPQRLVAEWVNRRTAADKVLRNKAFNIVKDKNMMDINVNLLQLCTNFLIKKNLVEQLKMKLCLKELAEELHKPFARKVDKRKVHSFSISNMWGAGLADMELISKFNK